MPKKILIVEDSPDIGNALKLLIELEGYEVAVAPTGAEGLDKSAAGRPDLIVIDYRLPATGPQRGRTHSPIAGSAGQRRHPDPLCLVVLDGARGGSGIGRVRRGVQQNNIHSKFPRNPQKISW